MIGSVWMLMFLNVDFGLCFTWLCAKLGDLLKYNIVYVTLLKNMLMFIKHTCTLFFVSNAIFILNVSVVISLLYFACVQVNSDKGHECIC